MERVFLTVLHMSITSSYVILFVTAARFLLKKMPKIFSYFLWLVVLFRLLCPFTIEGAVSFVPQSVSIQSQTSLSEAENANAGQTAAVRLEEGAEKNKEGEKPAVKNSSLNRKTGLKLLALVWFDIMVLFFSYHVFLTFRLRQRLLTARKTAEGIYVAEGMKTPFVFGIFHPRIYIPAHLPEAEKSYMICHEQVHLKRGDLFVKLLLFLALCIHWFNPFVWLAYRLAVTDMEMSCDESVIRIMGMEVKKEYTASLLTLAAGKAVWNQTGPLHFGEGDVKNRVKNVLNYQKPAFWVIALLTAAVAVLCIGLALNPADKGNKTDKTGTVSANDPETDSEGGEIKSEEKQNVSEAQRTETAVTIEEDIGSLEIEEERKERIKEVLGTEFDTMEELANAWASAVADREGHIVYGLLTDQGKQSFYEIPYTLSEEEDTYKSIGWSSPWPWGKEQYKLTVDQDTADITYYAVVSNPNIYIFRETLQGVWTEKGYRVAKSHFTDYTEFPVKTKEEFDYIYKMGYPDYMAEGFAEPIQLRVNESDESYFADYVRPDTAMISILGLEGGTAEVIKEEEGKAVVRYTFSDGKTAEVPMYQPVETGEHGIWIVQIEVRK